MAGCCRISHALSRAAAISVGQVCTYRSTERSSSHCKAVGRPMQCRGPHTAGRCMGTHDVRSGLFRLPHIPAFHCSPRQALWQPRRHLYRQASPRRLSQPGMASFSSTASSPCCHLRCAALWRTWLLPCLIWLRARHHGPHLMTIQRWAVRARSGFFGYHCAIESQVIGRSLHGQGGNAQ